MQGYLLAALVFLAGIAVFVFQNTSVVSVRFLNWSSPDVSLAVVVLIAVCAGAMTTFLLQTVRYFKVAKRMKDLVNHNRRLENEIASLKKENVVNQGKKKLEEPEETAAQSSGFTD